MAKLGRCRACRRQPISDEAKACPECGQPNPYEELPPKVDLTVGSVHEVTLSSVGPVRSGGSASRTLITVASMHIGHREAYFHPKHGDRYKTGDVIRVRIKEIHDNVHGAYPILVEPL